MSYYSEKTKKKIVKFKNKKLNIEIIFNPAQTYPNLREKIIEDIRKITISSWADFGQVVSQWFDWASILLIVRDGENVVAFSVSEFVNNNLVIFLSTMVLPNYQSIGISKKLQRLTVKEFLLKKFNINFLKYFKKLYFSFRTPNPRLIKAVLQYNIVPSIYGRKPTLEEIEIAKRIVNKFSPNCFFDEENLVIKGALKNNPSLILNQDEIQYSNNRKIDELCKKHLMYEKREGNLFVVVGSLNFLQKILVRFFG